MNLLGTVFLYAKYIVAGAVIIAIMSAPAWFSSQTKKNKTDSVIIRIASWLLGWTGIGWLVALYIAIKK